MKKGNLKRGFTLIELLVVVAIISLMSSIVIASVSQARKKVQTSGHLQTKDSVLAAFNAYYADNGKYPASPGNWWVCVGPATSYCELTGFYGDDTFWAAIGPYLSAVPTIGTVDPIYNNFFKYLNDSGGARLEWIKDGPISAAECDPSYVNQLDSTHWMCTTFLGY